MIAHYERSVAEWQLDFREAVTEIDLDQPISEGLLPIEEAWIEQGIDLMEMREQLPAAYRATLDEREQPR